MSNRPKLSVNAYEANSQFFRIIWMKDTVVLIEESILLYKFDI